MCLCAVDAVGAVGAWVRRCLMLAATLREVYDPFGVGVGGRGASWQGLRRALPAYPGATLARPVLQ